MFLGTGFAVAFRTSFYLLRPMLENRDQAATVPIIISCFNAGYALGVNIAGMIVSRTAIISGSGDPGSGEGELGIINTISALRNVFAVPIAAAFLAFAAIITIKVSHGSSG